MPKSGTVVRRCWTRCAAMVLVAGCMGQAAAQPTEHSYALESQDLTAALTEVARISDIEIVAPAEILAGLTARPLSGAMTAAEAVDRLLAETGLRAERLNGAFIIKREERRTESISEDDALITVTGTRIRGAPIASPVIALDQEDMRDAGQTNLGDVVRSIPQNFGGGQNPGIGFNVPATNGVDVGGGSSINLRGLGGDATLTLLNGHRLSYSSSRQSIDISSIPLGAVDRIEIVADGASAIYGSDAVAGVANIILKRDYEGLETTARFGASTDGGNVQQQYSAVAGTRWSSGGVITAYEFARNTPIEARQRSYAADRSPGLTLFPALKRHSATLGVHQALTANLSLEVDALYNKRWSDSVFPLNFAGDLDLSRGESPSQAESFVIAPSLKLALPDDWRLSFAGMYGEDRVNYRVDTFAGEMLTSSGGGCYCNSAKSVELNGDGSLFRLPGGLAKVAIGVGYRGNDFVSFRGVGNRQNVSRSQDSYYAYGELSLPLISADQEIPLVDRLNLTGAVRYERYPGVGSVATPKLGIIYAPTPDLTIKGSWGKSFRAPTLLQQYQLHSVNLVRASSLGGTGYPSSATALLLIGGNPELKPERATTWAATLDLHPRALPGAGLEISYFEIHYRDRIVTPVGFLAQALSNPIYRDLVTLSPSDTAKADAIVGAGAFVNAAGVLYDPANVVAIVNNSNLNAGRQSIRGIDVLADYAAELGSAGTLGITLNASYLDSEQQLSAGQPALPLAGMLFNPPHYRVRAGLSWRADPLTLTGNLNYTGSVEDTRFTPSPRVGSMTTLDLTARYRIDEGRGPLSDIDLSLSVHNILNDRPDQIATTLFFDTPYDSTNYSPVGRFVSLAISKKW